MYSFQYAGSLLQEFDPVVVGLVSYGDDRFLGHSERCIIQLVLQQFNKDLAKLDHRLWKILCKPSTLLSGILGCFRRRALEFIPKYGVVQKADH